MLDLKTSITKLHGGVWGRQCLFALDQTFDKSGQILKENTGAYVPNEYVFKVAQDNLAHFGMISFISIDNFVTFAF